MSDHNPLLAGLVLSDPRPAVPLWRFSPVTLEDAPFREELREAIVRYFEDNKGKASDCTVEWEALKVVIRGHCIEKTVGIRKELKKELLGAENKLLS